MLSLSSVPLWKRQWVIPACSWEKANPGKAALGWSWEPQEPGEPRGRRGCGCGGCGGSERLPVFCLILSSAGQCNFLSFHWCALQLWLIIEFFLKFHNPAPSTVFLSKLLSQMAAYGFSCFMLNTFGVIKMLFFVDMYEFWKVVTLRNSLSIWLSSRLMRWKKMRYKIKVIHQLRNNTCIRYELNKNEVEWNFFKFLFIN